MLIANSSDKLNEPSKPIPRNTAKNSDVVLMESFFTPSDNRSVPQAQLSFYSATKKKKLLQ